MFIGDVEEGLHAEGKFSLDMCGCIECWLIIVEQGWWLGKTQDLHRTSTSTLVARISLLAIKL